MTTSTMSSFFHHSRRSLLLLTIVIAYLAQTLAQGVDPTIIQTCETETTQITVTVPASTDTEPVDVMFLFDDTGTFARASSQLANQFASLVTELTAAFPSVDFGYGVGKYEDYGGLSGDYGGLTSGSRPAILNQPIVTAAELGGDADALGALIVDALRRSAPENGGDIPESAIEGLYNLAVGSGYDGNGDGSFLGIDGTQIAGAVATQTLPDTSGDVPNIGSLDPALLTAGSVGGGLFRPGSKKLLILATDACTVAPFDGEIPATISSEFSTEPSEEFSCGGGVRYGLVGDSLVKADSTIPRSIAPLGAHTVPETVAALVANGIRVVGLSASGGATPSGSGPSDQPNVFLSALARLTGGVDANGDALVSEIDVNDAGAIQAAILNAISTFVAPPVDVQVSPQGCDTIDGLELTFDPPTVEGVSPGANVTFDVSFDIDPARAAGSCELQFVDGTGTVLATDAIQLEVCLESESPSFAPTPAGSTLAPSGAPSVAPSAEEATSAPTTAPSIAPSTGVTTETPSSAPSIAGTLAPTLAGASQSPSTPPTILPTTLPTAALSEGSPTRTPSASPTAAPTVAGTKRPTGPPNTMPTFSPSVSSVPTSAPTSQKPTKTKAPVKSPLLHSLFGQNLGTKFFTTVNTGKGGNGGGGQGPGPIRFDFTHPGSKGGGGAGSCWGFDCDGHGGGKGGGHGGGYSKGSKAASGGYGKGSYGSKAIKGKAGGKAGASKGGKGKGSNYYYSKGSKATSDGHHSSGVETGHIFEVIFTNDHHDSASNAKARRERKRERRVHMNTLRRERIRTRKMARAMGKSPAAPTTSSSSGGGERSEPDQFILVSDLKDDTAADKSTSGIVFITTQMIDSGNDRVRRRALAAEETPTER